MTNVEKLRAIESEMEGYAGQNRHDEIPLSLRQDGFEQKKIVFDNYRALALRLKDDDPEKAREYALRAKLTVDKLYELL